MAPLGIGKTDEDWRVLTYSTDEKEFFCYSCETELDGDELEWYNDTPVCPHCDNEIEL